jgi:D-serine deaminase-like pyridoxal phosphate-dependent protein
MDADYGRNLDRDDAPTKAFEPSLFVWATVMSRPAEDRAIVDAGLKALAFDPGPPLVWDEPAATYEAPTVMVDAWAHDQFARGRFNSVRQFTGSGLD